MRKLVFQIGIATAFATLAAWRLRPDALDGASAEIVAFLSIVMAAVLPTMLLSATILKADNLNLTEIAAYRTALDRQMSFWIGMLIWTLVSIMALVAGRATGWEIPELPVPYRTRDISVSWLFNAVVVFSLVIVGLRFPACEDACNCVPLGGVFRFEC